jgi:hypothetical protein
MSRLEQLPGSGSAHARLRESVYVEGVRRTRTLAVVGTEQLRPYTYRAIADAAARLPAGVTAVLIEDAGFPARRAMTLADCCKLPVWVKRPAGRDTIYLPVPLFNRLCPSRTVGVSGAYIKRMQAAHGKDFSASDIRSMAYGSFNGRCLGEYTEADMSRALRIMFPGVEEIHLHDHDSPPDFAQAMADRTGHKVSNWHSYGLATYVPRGLAIEALPLSARERSALYTLESGRGILRYTDDDANYRSAFDSYLHLANGRLTQHELRGDYSEACAFALAAMIPPDLRRIVILDPACPPAFGPLLARAAQMPVRLHGVDYGGDLQPRPTALNAGPMTALEAALKGKETLARYFVREGRLLQEDIKDGEKGYLHARIAMLADAIDPGARAIHVLDDDCPRWYLHSLASAANKAVLHQSWIYLPRDVRERRMHNPAAGWMSLSHGRSREWARRMMERRDIERAARRSGNAGMLE